VPYGRNFDQQRLIGSLCLNEAGDGLAISDKGRTAAEMMVFARYVMFSEVYWHHAVRAATAMLQRAFFLLRDQLDLDSLFRRTESRMITELRRVAQDGPAAELLDGLFGPVRRLYKRLAQFSFFEQREWYEQLARRPFPWLVRCSEVFADRISRQLGRRVAPSEVLFDAPPTKLEVQFQVDIHFPKEPCYRPLGDVSPVVSTLARKQFDDYVKRVRIFVHPRWPTTCAPGPTSLPPWPRRSASCEKTGLARSAHQGCGNGPGQAIRSSSSSADAGSCQAPAMSSTMSSASHRSRSAMS
jgi:uncharacterized protein